MLYTPVSIVVGMVLVADAVQLLRTDGKTEKINSFTSMVEVMWFIISLVYLFTTELYGLAQLIPILFVSYVITGFIATLSMVRQIELPEDVGDIRVPRNYIIVALLFGVLFSAANVLLLIFQQA